MPIAESLEEAQIYGRDDLKDFIRNELLTLRYGLLLKVFAFATGTAGLLLCRTKTIHVICYFQPEFATYSFFMS